MNIKYFIYIILSFLLIESKAQEEKDLQVWSGYTLRNYFSKPKFWLYNDLSIRQTINNSKATVYRYRPKIEFNVGNISEIHTAVEIRHTNNPDLRNENEIRTWQGYELNWPQIGRFMFEHFYRFEQRFHFIEGAGKDEFALRSRYRCRCIFPLNKDAITRNTVYMNFSGELFFPHGRDIVERYASTIRAGSTLGYNINGRWRVFFIYLLDFAEEIGIENRTVNNNIFSFNIRTTI